jgi:DNA-binding NtrC family response regulator
MTPTVSSRFLGRGRPTVLVVDDDLFVLDVSKRFLEQRGFHVSVASEAGRALEVLDEGQVNAVLLDVHMPHQDGLALLPKFRALYPDVPVVMLTGDGYRPELMDRCGSLGAAGFVSKHTELENVALAVRRAVKGAASRPSPRPAGRAAPAPVGAEFAA